MEKDPKWKRWENRSQKVYLHLSAAPARKVERAWRERGENKKGSRTCAAEGRLTCAEPHQEIIRAVRKTRATLRKGGQRRLSRKRTIGTHQQNLPGKACIRSSKGKKIDIGDNPNITGERGRETGGVSNREGISLRVVLPREK